MIEVGAILATASVVWQTVGGSVAAIAKDAAHKAISSRVDELADDYKSRLQAKLSLPGNHDLVRGIRSDYLTALQTILDYYRKDFEGNYRTRQDGDDAAFIETMKEWLSVRLHLLRGSGADHDAVTGDDIRAVLEDITQSSVSSVLKRDIRKIRLGVEERALDEVKRVWLDELPPLFMRWFKGTAGSVGFYDVFSLHINQRLKDSKRFFNIFVVHQLADTNAIIREASKRVEAIQAAISKVEETLGKLVRKVDKLTSKVDQMHALIERL